MRYLWLFLLSGVWGLSVVAQPLKTPDDIDRDSLGDPPVITSMPINTLEAIAMRQELQDLIGRVESAMLAGGIQGENAILLEAKNFLKQMPGLIAQGRDLQVRTQWEQLRQNLWRAYPTDALSSLPEVRAIWLDRGTIVAAKSAEGLKGIFDRMAAAGVNTVFIETVNAGYPIYPSSVAPEQNPLTKGWDPLAVAVKLAQERKMEIHAWVWVFAAGNRRHNLLVGKDSDYPGPVLSLYPQWADASASGSIFPPENKTFLDPANPQVQEYLLRLYREIITRYDVDGLHLDYIRYPRQSSWHSASYGQASREGFKQLTGVDPVNITPNDRSLWWLWTQYRAEQINQFVARVAKELRPLRPRLVISAAVFPWKQIDRLNRIQQNWETWVAEGHVDWLVPMTYAPETSRFLQEKVQPALTGMGASPGLFLPGVLLKNVSEGELLDKLQAVRDLPAGGFSLFAAEYLNAKHEELLKSTRSTPEGRILPHRNPFQAALIRYELLLKEWQPFLAGERLWLRGLTLQAMQNKTQAFKTALVNLQTSPTRTNYQAAITALRSLSQDLPQWLRLEALERPYRVNTWHNRLTAIERMLQYGERTIIASKNNKLQANVPSP
ncbi:MAG: family 10 glycosylhydrolase [Pseudanabaenaceae cyanobacterium SKYGB_i_bin29]|nr:family 10 glycosylhydrolase [Pseudanabaenaceae cyanobacterium SKYG29]MDW8420923.1 family 10 glycosylhydrolase [Pseudanabaenaceae cyanobacterium SKYGB_i_bin29]